MVPHSMPPSEFQQRVSLFPVPLIIERIGCGQSVAYAWQQGTRTPEPWQQELILEKLGSPPEASEPVKRGRGRPRKVTGAVPRQPG